MADTGGGAEARARLRQFDYRTNPSLVLTTDSRSRDTHEPTGEAQSLWGKIDPKSFGSRACVEKPQKHEKSLKKKERGIDFDADPSRRKKIRLLREESVLASLVEGLYQPKTIKTRAAYEYLLSVIQKQLGGQPLNVVTGAADEILAVLKNEGVKNHDKKEDIGKLLNPITSCTFDRLVEIGREITDYHDDVVYGDHALDDGVTVQFEENEEGGEESELRNSPKTKVHSGLALVPLSFALRQGSECTFATSPRSLDNPSIRRKQTYAYQPPRLALFLPIFS